MNRNKRGKTLTRWQARAKRGKTCNHCKAREVKKKTGNKEGKYAKKQAGKHVTTVKCVK